MKEIIKSFCYTLKGSKTLKKYKEFKKREYSSFENNLKFQEERLKKILLHSWENVPYYSRVLEEVGVVVDGNVNLDNFEKIPILTKDIVRREGKDLYSKDHSKRKSFFNTSGGSTGEPLKLLQDKLQKEENMAMAWVQNSYICDMPHKIIKLWGSERDILGKPETLEGKFTGWLLDTKLLNSFRMSKEMMREYAKIINKFKPDIIESYVQSIYEFAKFLEEKNIKIYSPKGVITSAGTLYPHMKKEIEAVFGCQVHNRYGSREVSSLACSCKKDNGLHVNMFTNYMEILNDELNACKPGETGKVYVTTLNNFSMPLIRYDIGDIVETAKEKKCDCGRNTPLIKSVKGRDNSIIKTKKATLDSVALSTNFYAFKSIQKYRIVQKTYNYFEIQVEINNMDEWTEEKKKLKRKLTIVLGDDVTIDIITVESIPSLDNGKYQYIISEVE